MFGFWFAVVGLIFGTLCSYMAKKKNRSQKEWFTIGLIFSIAGLFLIALLPKLSVDLQTDLFDDNSEDQQKRSFGW